MEESLRIIEIAIDKLLMKNKDVQEKEDIDILVNTRNVVLICEIYDLRDEYFNNIKEIMKSEYPFYFEGITINHYLRRSNSNGYDQIRLSLFLIFFSL
jgi:methyl coenzyme M reductase subunit D